MGENGLYLAVVNLQNLILAKEAYAMGLLSTGDYKEYISALMEIQASELIGGLNGTDEKLSDLVR